MTDNEAAQPAAKPSGPPATSVGQKLRQARTAQGLSLEEISADLRIEARQLDALERDDFAGIGVPVFVKGYIKQFALRLGLDPKEVIAIYQRQVTTEDVVIQPSKTIKLHDDRQTTVWVSMLVAVVILVVLLVLWWLDDPLTFFSDLGLWPS